MSSNVFFYIVFVALAVISASFTFHSTRINAKTRFPLAYNPSKLNVNPLECARKDDEISESNERKEEFSECVLSPHSWTKKILRLKPIPIAEIKSFNGINCIINKPNLTMSNPYIGASREIGMAAIESVLEQLPDFRAKAVCVT